MTGFILSIGFSVGEAGASPPCFFPTRLERAFCMVEDSTIHTCKVCTLATFHSIHMNLGLYMNAGEAKIKIIRAGVTAVNKKVRLHCVLQIRSKRPI